MRRWLEGLFLIMVVLCPIGAFAQSSATGKIGSHEYVDLGLSVLWATCNVGASSPEGYGDYYAWGETETKSSYTENNCQTYNKSISDIKGTSRDVAHVKWGDSWRMPTKVEFEELRKDNCEWEWTTVNGVNGYKVTSKKAGYEGNSIFLPAAGWKFGASMDDQDQRGYYWNTTPGESNTQDAYYLRFRSGYHDTDCYYYRHCGCTVRPVASKESSQETLKVSMLQITGEEVKMFNLKTNESETIFGATLIVCFVYEVSGKYHAYCAYHDISSDQKQELFSFEISKVSSNDDGSEIYFTGTKEDDSGFVDGIVYDQSREGLIYYKDREHAVMISGARLVKQ